MVLVDVCLDPIEGCTVCCCHAFHSKNGEIHQVARGERPTPMHLSCRPPSTKVVCSGSPLEGCMRTRSIQLSSVSARMHLFSQEISVQSKHGVGRRLWSEIKMGR